MFTKRYLTPLDLERIDPTGALRLKLRNMDRERFMPPSKYFAAKQPFEWLDLLEAIQTSPTVSSHLAYVEYNRSLYKKFGKQGGTFGLNKLLECYEASYSNAESNPQFSRVIRGRDYLIRYCRQLVERFGYPQPVPSACVATHSAVPYALSKGSYFAETVEIPGTLQHLKHDFPGMRRQRNKDRTINQDACSNVRFIEDLLNGIRNWAKKYISWFSSWLNPADGVQPAIYRLMRKPFTAIMFDFEHMDEHFSRKVALEVVLPIWEQLLTPAEYIHMACFLEEAFEQPIFFGTFELTGLHNLLSGQSITNDIETWYGIALLVGSILTAGGDLLKWLVLALGDDSLLMTNSERHLVQAVKEAYVEEANLNCVVVNEDKTDEFDDRVIYLRRLYTRDGIYHYNRNGDPYFIGAYPSVLALNNIVQPERLSKSPGLAFCATCQRLDNVYGSPDYYQLVDKVFKHARGLRKPTQEEVEEFSLQDWWSRLYGDTWNPLTSRTAQIVLLRNKLH